MKAREDELEIILGSLLGLIEASLFKIVLKTLFYLSIITIEPDLFQFQIIPF